MKFSVLGFRGLGFRGLGFRGLGFVIYLGFVEDKTRGSSGLTVRLDLGVRSICGLLHAVPIDGHSWR